MIQVAIVDDHQIVRTGFRELLSEDSSINLGFEAANGDEALEKLRSSPCDVLLLDISLPGKSGVDVLRTVRQRYPETRVLILSGFPEESYALAMIRNGASGYLCKDCDGDELLRAIHMVATGRRYVSGRWPKNMASLLSTMPVRRLSTSGSRTTASCAAIWSAAPSSRYVMSIR